MEMHKIHPQMMLFFVCLFLLGTSVTYAGSTPLTPAELQAALARDDYQALKPSGAAIIEPLLTLYQAGDADTRRRVANALYYLSIKSAHAREVLMQDVHTQHPQLRLAVQWALGRVSDDTAVVRVLLDNMENDPNPHGKRT